MTQKVRFGGLFALALTGLIFTFVVGVQAQDEEETQPAAPTAKKVNVKKEGLAISDPKLYEVPLRTVPIKQIDLVAHEDGVVINTSVKPGDRVNIQAEAVRLDDSRHKLVSARAKGLLDAAKAEQKIADASKDADRIEAATARMNAAEAEFNLAEMSLQATISRVPFAGEILDVYVVAGQYVRAGDKLLTLADTSNYQVRVPIDRTVGKVGGEHEILIEKTAFKGKITAILPPESRFDPVRNLVNSLSTALIEIPNPNGEYFPGQTVYSKLLPQKPFALVLISAIQNQGDGVRKIQIVRQGVVRDVPIEELTQSGTDRVFVAGAFIPGDEIILSSSEPLLDGQILTVPTPNARPGQTQPGVRSPTTGF